MKASKPVEVGYWMAVALRKGEAPLSSYVGQVQATDVHGIRLSLVDWLVMQALGEDLYLPWSSITSSLVATEDHDLDLFFQDARKWQSTMNE